MKAERLDKLFSLGLLALGVWIVIRAIGYGITGPYVTGAGFFPLIAGLIIIVCTIGNFLSSRHKDEFDGESLTAAHLRPILLLSLSTVIFILAIPIAGMVLLTGPYVAASAYIIDWPSNGRGHAIVWVLATATALAFYLLFERLLQIPLPWGLLES